MAARFILFSWRIPTTVGGCWPDPSVLFADGLETAHQAGASTMFLDPIDEKAGTADLLRTGRVVSHSVVIDDDGPVLTVLLDRG